jgi:hypothetical protein
MQIKSNDAYKKNDLKTYSEICMQMLMITGNICYKVALRDTCSFLSEI